VGWLAHVLGLDSGSGYWYLFWSGFGSDIAEIAIIGGLISIYRRHNCEVHGCWRLGRHATAAGQHVCRRHHPDGHLTAEKVRRDHHLYLGSKPGPG
jgi:hypothetical protein